MTVRELSIQPTQGIQMPYTIFIGGGNDPNTPYTRATMKWMIWVEPNQTFIENYPDGWNHADVERAANNRYGGKVTTVSPAPSRGSHESYNGSRGGGSSSGGGSGCMSLLGLIALIVIGGLASGGGGDKTPTESPQNAPMERVQAAPAPVAPVTEPQFRDYASPPPSYCITENFEPC